MTVGADVMKLLLPGNYIDDLEKFNSLRTVCAHILSGLVEVLWFDEEDKYPKYETKLIDNVKHIITDFSDDSFNSDFTDPKNFICFTPYLNDSIISILEEYPHTTCYYLNPKIDEYQVIEHLVSLVSIYDSLTPFKDFLYEKEEKKLQISEGKDFFLNLYQPYYNSMSNKQREYGIFYKEKFFYNRFINYLRIKNKSELTKISAQNYIKGDSKTLIDKSKVVLISEFDKLDRDDQEFVINSFKGVYKKIKYVFFDCGNSFENDFLKSHFLNNLILPDSDSVKDKYYPTGIFLFMLKELENEIDVDLEILSYVRFYGDDLLKLLIFNKYSIPQIYQSLKTVIPKGKYVVDISDVNLWYALIQDIKQHYVTNEVKNNVALDPSIVKEDQSETRIDRTVNPEPETDVALIKKIIKNGEIIEIFYNGRRLPITDPTLDGLFYIYYIIRNDYPGIGIKAEELYLKLKPAALTTNVDFETVNSESRDEDEELDFSKAKPKKNESNSIKSLREELKELFSNKKELQEQIALNENKLDEFDLTFEERERIFDLIKKANNKIDKINADMNTTRDEISKKTWYHLRPVKRIKERLAAAFKIIEAANIDCAIELDECIDYKTNYFKYIKPETGSWIAEEV